MKGLILHSFLVLFGTSVLAQNPFVGKLKTDYWSAEELYDNGDLIGAINLFKSLYSENGSYPPLNFYLGDAYFQLKKYEQANLYLEKVKGINDAYYELAYLQLHKGDAVNARTTLGKYAWNKDSKFTKVESEQLMQNTASYHNLILEPDVVKIINLGKQVNTQVDEYVPLISSDEELLLFTSRRVIEGDSLDPLGRPYEDVYFSDNKLDWFEWNDAALLDGEVNTPLNDACVGLSPDGATLYLFRTNKNLVGGDLYESKLIDERWTAPVIMSTKINGALSIEPSASISLDGSTFFFSSNREGGFGGFDLYRVIKFPNGEWSDALNLGPEINTALDEDSPFIHPDGKTLYFSSEGHENMGGFDVFKAELKDEKWTNVQNLGSPTNTSKDDIHFVISANEKHGYYSSNKEGGFGGQDIYSIDYLEKTLHQSVISAVVTLDGKVAEDIEVSLMDLETDKLKGLFRSNARTGKFIFLVNPNVEYELIVEGENFEVYSEIVRFTMDDLFHKQKVLIKLRGEGE